MMDLRKDHPRDRVKWGKEDKKISNAVVPLWAGGPYANVTFSGRLSAPVCAKSIRCRRCKNLARFSCPRVPPLPYS